MRETAIYTDASSRIRTLLDQVGRTVSDIMGCDESETARLVDGMTQPQRVDLIGKQAELINCYIIRDEEAAGMLADETEELSSRIRELERKSQEYREKVRELEQQAESLRRALVRTAMALTE